MNISSGLHIGCQKVTNMHPNSHGKKYWFVFKKKALQETNGSDMGCKFSSSLV